LFVKAFKYGGGGGAKFWGYGGTNADITLYNSVILFSIILLYTIQLLP
jgi:hypothetical protein